jgi:hypothetical protein
MLVNASGVARIMSAKAEKNIRRIEPDAAVAAKG